MKGVPNPCNRFPELLLLGGMKSHQRLQICLVVGLVVLCFLTACTPDDPTSPTGVGALFGSITLVDEYNDTAAVQSGATITAIASGGARYSATTDAQGNWRIDDIPAEIYYVYAAHADYDSAYSQTTFAENLGHPGVGALKVAPFRLAKTPAVDLASITLVTSAWQKDSTWDGYWRYSSHYVCTIVLESKEDRPFKRFSYLMQFSSTPDAPCDTPGPGTTLNFRQPTLTRSGRMVTIELVGYPQSDSDSLNRQLEGKTMYLQLRREYGLLNPSRTKWTAVCLQPFVVPIPY